MVGGAVCSLAWAETASAGASPPAWILIAVGATAWVAWLCERQRLTVALLAVSFVGAGALLAIDAREKALRTPLRGLLSHEVGGFAIDTLGPGVRHDPLPIRARLTEDASQGSDVTTLRASITAVRFRGGWHKTHGDVSLSVGGTAAPERIGEWRAGRRVEAWATFRRPARYLNDGVPDFEHDLALHGTTLFGSVKSGLLVDVTKSGSRIEEAAASVRRHVRHSVERWVGRHDALSAAIVTAVLIGDRTGLPADIRLRLQTAGTYHVIAISGGNIAIFAGLVLTITPRVRRERPSSRDRDVDPAGRLRRSRHCRCLGVARHADGRSLSRCPGARSPEFAVARARPHGGGHRQRATARRARRRLHLDLWGDGGAAGSGASNGLYRDSRISTCVAKGTIARGLTAEVDSEDSRRNVSARSQLAGCVDRGVAGRRDCFDAGWRVGVLAGDECRSPAESSRCTVDGARSSWWHGRVEPGRHRDDRIASQLSGPPRREWTGQQRASR